MRRNWASQASDGLVAALVAWVLVAVSLTRFDTWVLAEVLFAAMASVGIQRLVTSGRGQRYGYIAVTIALAALWVITFGSWVTPFGLLGWLIYLLRRIQLTHDGHDDDLQSRRLVWDLVYVGGALLAVILLNPPSDLLALALLLGLAAASIRILAMHYAERNRVGTLVSQKRPNALLPIWVVGGSVTLLLVLGAVFPGFREWAIYLILGAGGVYLAIRLWRDWLGQIVVGIVVVGLILLIQKLVGHRKAKKSNTHIGLPKGFKLPKHAGGHLTLPTLDWGLIAVVAALAVIVWVAIRSRAQTLDDRLAEAGLLVERQSLGPGRRRGPRTGTTPIRDLVGRWLTWKMRHGHPLEPGETLRAYAERSRQVEAEAPPDLHDTLGVLSREYEAERYGQQEAPLTRVQELEALLAALGLWRRKGGSGAVRPPRPTGGQ